MEPHLTRTMLRPTHFQGGPLSACPPGAGDQLALRGTTGGCQIVHSSGYDGGHADLSKATAQTVGRSRRRRCEAVQVAGNLMMRTGTAGHGVGDAKLLTRPASASASASVLRLRLRLRASVS